MPPKPQEHHDELHRPRGLLLVWLLMGLLAVVLVLELGWTLHLQASVDHGLDLMAVLMELATAG